MHWYLRLLNPDVAFLIMWVSYEICTNISCHMLLLCLAHLPANGTIPRKVNTMISSPYLNCKTESPAEPNEDWKRQNVLQSLNCGLRLQDILFSREHLLFSVVLKSLPSFYYLSPGNGFEHQCFLLTILIINILNDFPKIPSGLCTYPYHTLQKVT